MIQQINTTPIIYQQTAPVQAMPAPFGQPVKTVENANLQGAEALANYNMPIVTQHSPFAAIVPIEPTMLDENSVNKIPGERVYTSYGNLKEIVQKTPQTTTILGTMDNSINQITVIDNNTGLPLRDETRLFLHENGKPAGKPTILIHEFMPGSDKIAKSSFYRDGQHIRTSVNEYGPGDYKKITGNLNGNVIVEEESESQNFTKSTSYNDKGQITGAEIYDYNQLNGQKTEYKDGIPVKTTPITKPILENTTGRNPKEDPNLKPAEKFVLDYDPKQLQGGKSYYSNGALEKISAQATNGHVSYKYEPDGKLSGIDFEYPPTYSKGIINDKDSYTIMENWPEAQMRKETVYTKTGGYCVMFVDENQNLRKSVRYDKNGKLERYTEDSYKDFKTLLNVLYDSNENTIQIEKPEEKKA